MNFQSITVVLSVVYLLACTTLTREEQINSTCKRIINSINKNDLRAFEKLVNEDPMDYEKMEFDFKNLHKMFIDHHINENSEIDISHLYNIAGQRLVRIPIDKTDTSSSMVRLNLFFGPPSINPLNQVSGYEVVWDNKDRIDFVTVDKKHQW